MKKQMAKFVKQVQSPHLLGLAFKLCSKKVAGSLIFLVQWSVFAALCCNLKVGTLYLHVQNLNNLQDCLKQTS